jgi:hypothetical protein
VAGAREAKFTTLVLLDDFSASGISYLREEEGEPKGKIAKIAKQLAEVSALLDPENLEVHILLYVATDKAIEYLEGRLAELTTSIPGRWTIERIQGLNEGQVMRRGNDPRLDELVDLAYVDKIKDKHMEKGGTDGRYGFADCGLSVVLAHNTPNNSLAILWADIDTAKALFPRVTRHREGT